MGLSSRHQLTSNLANHLVRIQRVRQKQIQEAAEATAPAKTSKSKDK